MQRLLLRRCVQGVITLWAVVVMVFLLVRLTGDPLQRLMPLEATEEDFRVTRQALGLDKPLSTQYAIYIANLARGDLGKSLRSKRPVAELILERLPNSVKLSGFAMVIALLLAMPLGVIAATKKGTALDTLARVIAFLGQSMPTFWLGLVLMLIFAVYLRWLPTSGMGSPLHYLMPGFTLGWFVVAGMMRLLRSSMLEVLDSEYIRLARVKGVSERRIIWLHAFRNALIPVVTFAGFYFATLIGAAVVVETVFNWPGIGMLAYEALTSRDFSVIQGVVLTVAAIVILVNLLVDVLYAYIDPRIKY